MAVDRPITYSEAISVTEERKWRVALEDELNAVKDSGTIIPAKLPAGR